MLDIVLGFDFFLLCIDLPPYFVIINFVTFVKNTIDKDVSFDSTIKFPKIIHVHLTDERTPFVVPECTRQQLFDKLIEVVDVHLCAILREGYNLGIFLY